MSRKSPVPPRIAIVGRPNVGKSTLFNLLAVGEKAITHATAGTTRDTRETPGDLFGLTFTLLDTAGLENPGQIQSALRSLTAAKPQGTSQSPVSQPPLNPKDSGLSGRLTAAALASAQTADLLLFMVDGAAGVLPADRTLAQVLRKLGKPVLVLLNKADLKQANAHLADVESLGFGEPLLISAAHNQGVGDLHEKLQTVLEFPPVPEQERGAAPGSRRARREAAKAAADAAAVPSDAAKEPSVAADASNKNNKLSDTPQGPLRIAILGRPNVGKSTLVNALLRDERMLTGAEAGLTREAISHKFSYKNREMTIVDTPGLRRKGRVGEGGLEFLSVGQSLQAAEKADIIILLVDASGHNIGAGKWQIFEQQDAQIASMILNQYKPLIIGLTKWDAVEDPEACLADVQIQLHHRLHELHTPLAVPLSSIQGKGIKTLLEAIFKVDAQTRQSFSTGKLNNLLNKVLAKKSPPLANGKVVSLKFIRQTGSNPPSFTFWGNRISEVSNSYKQFLRNQLAESLGLLNVAVQIYFRANANPFGKKTNK